MVREALITTFLKTETLIITLLNGKRGPDDNIFKEGSPDLATAKW